MKIYYNQIRCLVFSGNFPVIHAGLVCGTGDCAVNRGIKYGLYIVRTNEDDDHRFQLEKYRDLDLNLLPLKLIGNTACRKT